jgi:hypothetical protein
VRESDVDAAPGIVRGGEVIGDDPGDHGATTPALRAGFEPTAMEMIGAGETLGIGFIARSDGREATGG